MSIETNWYVYREQQRWGPYTWQQILEMVQGGQVNPNDQLWHPQYPNKVSANQVQGLSESFKSRDSTSQSNVGSQEELPHNTQPEQVAQKNQEPKGILDCMVTTALELPGYRITHSFGIVQALVVPALGYGTPFATVFTGIKGALTGPSQQALGEAYKRALQTAAQLGANAIIGFHFNSDQTGYLAYGTAVWVEPDTMGQD
jgi:uncharacterized protein YbjQ (UPF0145 family)